MQGLAAVREKTLQDLFINVQERGCCSLLVLLHFSFINPPEKVLFLLSVPDN